MFFFVYESVLYIIAIARDWLLYEGILRYTSKALDHIPVY